MSRSACSTRSSRCSVRRAAPPPRLHRPADSMPSTPSHPATGATPAQKKLADRLRYYEDLGIRSFYLDRTSPMAKSLMAKTSATQMKTAPEPAAVVAAARAPLAQPTATAAAKGGQGIVQGPSLFEA